MAEVLLLTDDLTVLGGPSSIDVSVDFGPPGQRGSLIYASNGVPSDPNSGIPSDVLPYDLAINVSASSNRYLTIYQYFSADGASGWNELTRLSPNVGAVNLDIPFVEGVGQIIVPISAITQSTEFTPANFNIQYSIESVTPILSSLLVSPTFIPIENITYLGFQINAIEFNGVGFAAVDGVSKRINLLITVI